MADQWDHMFDPMITITVSGDMLGHVRVTGTNVDTGEKVQKEVDVWNDDPSVTTREVGDALREVFIALDQD